MLCVTIYPRRDYLAGLAALAWDAFFVVILYQLWSRIPLSFRVIWIVILSAAFLSTAYEFLGDEVLEFDWQKLSVRKGVHGWERKREYPIAQCSNLAWDQGRRGGSYLTCKEGGTSIKFGKRLSEAAANEIMSALQRALPDAAQKVGPYPGTKEHSVTLELNK